MYRKTDIYEFLWAYSKKPVRGYASLYSSSSLHLLDMEHMVDTILVFDAVNKLYNFTVLKFCDLCAQQESGTNQYLSRQFKKNLIRKWILFLYRIMTSVQWFQLGFLFCFLIFVTF